MFDVMRSKTTAWMGALLATFALGLTLTSATPAAAEDKAPEAAAEAPDGAKLWKKKCKTCHGKDGLATKVGTKKNAPADIRTKAKTMSVEDIVKVVTEGKEKMKGYKDKLSEAEIKAVSEYTKSTYGK